MNYCKCGCGLLVQENYKKGHGRRGKHNSLDHNNKIRSANIGRKNTKPAWNKGKTGLYHHSQETIEKIRNVAQTKGFGKWMTGKKRTQETKDKIQETRRKLGINRQSEEIKRKISFANSGAKNGMYHYKFSKEERQKRSERTKKRWKDPEYIKKMLPHLNKFREGAKEFRKNHVFPKKDTSIEVKIQKFLELLNIKFQKHLYIQNIEHGYQCDLYISTYNTIIECDGDYWHNYPNLRDIDIKRTNEMLNCGYKVIRLWERTIKKMTIDEFKKKIYDFWGIKENGEIS